MTLESVKFAFLVYGIAAIVAFLVAGIIKLTFAAINFGKKMKAREKQAAAKPAAESAGEV